MICRRWRTVLHTTRFERSDNGDGHRGLRPDRGCCGEIEGSVSDPCQEACEGVAKVSKSNTAADTNSSIIPARVLSDGLAATSGSMANNAPNFQPIP